VHQLRELFCKLPYAFVVCGVRTAGMLKHVCNAFDAVKSAFANEGGRLRQALEINSQAVIDLVCLDTQLNIPTADLRPGPRVRRVMTTEGLAGPAARGRSVQRGHADPSGVHESNETHLHHGIESVPASGGTSVGILGLSFKR
jgi:GDP-mannose 6-dehydrogenase